MMSEMKLDMNAMAYDELPADAFEKLPEDQKNNEFIAMESKTYFQDVWFNFNS